MKLLFDNFRMLLAGMVTMTFCLAVLGVIFLPAFGYAIDSTAQVFVFSILQGIAFAVGLSRENVARTLGIKE